MTDGLITQAQADAMLNGTAGQRGVRVDLRGANLDHEKYLAEALGITVEKLQASWRTRQPRPKWPGGHRLPA